MSEGGQGSELPPQQSPEFQPLPPEVANFVQATEKTLQLKDHIIKEKTEVVYKDRSGILGKFRKGREWRKDSAASMANSDWESRYRAACDRLFGEGGLLRVEKPGEVLVWLTKEEIKKSDRQTHFPSRFRVEGDTVMFDEEVLPDTQPEYQRGRWTGRSVSGEKITSSREAQTSELIAITNRLNNVAQELTPANPKAA
jgi:hypothetical protein